MVCHHHLQKYGPDCGLVDIFNWNNHYGFTHELLNEYTFLFTSTIVPFLSFVTSHHHAYTDSLSPFPFCSTKTFTCIWFAFIELQVLDSGMQCISCGKHPEVMITDRVSIAYSSSKFVQGLLPPSAMSAASPVNYMVSCSHFCASLTSEMFHTVCLCFPPDPSHLIDPLTSFSSVALHSPTNSLQSLGSLVLPAPPPKDSHSSSTQSNGQS